jgi:hypothetical protein
LNFQPFIVARYGVYAAGIAGAISVWLGAQAGASLDYALLRAVFVFILFTALALGAEALLSSGWQATPPPVPSQSAEETEHE